MPVVDTLRISYVVDVADRATKPMLAAQRQVQRGVTQTSRTLAHHDAVVKRSGAVAAAASAKKSAAHHREGRAVQLSAAGTTRLAAAQQTGLAAAKKSAAAALNVSVAYNKQAAAAHRLTAAERARAAAASAAAAANASAVRVRAGSTAALGGAATAGAVASRGVRGVGGAGIVSAIGIGTALAQTIKFDKAMRNVNSIAQLNEQQFKALGKSVQGLAGQTAQAPVTLAEGLYDLVSSGFNAKDSLAVLEKSARAATAGLTTTDVSTKVVAGALNSYSLGAEHAGKVSDILFRTVDRGVISFEQLAQNLGPVLPAARALGVGLEEVGAAAATMTKQGMPVPETMTSINAAMTALSKPSKAAEKALRELGVKGAAELIQKSGGLQGALEALVSTTDGSAESIGKLFANERARRGVNVLVGNAKAARADLEGMRDSAGATARALEQQSKSISYQWNHLKAQSSSLAISVGSKLVPALGGVLNAMNKLATGRGRVAGFLNDVARGFKGVRDEAAKPITRALGQRAAGAIRTTPRSTDQLRGTLRPAAPTAAQRAGEQARIVLSKLADTAKRAGSALVTAGKQLFDAFKPAAPFLRNVLLPLLTGIAKGVIASVVVAFKIAVPVIKIAATVLGAVGKAARPLRGVFEGIGGVIGLLVAGPILRLLGTLPKLGAVFRVLAIPVKIVGGAISRLGARLTGLHRGPMGLVVIAAKLLGRTIIGSLGKVAGRVGGMVATIAKGFVRLGKGIVSAIVDGIKSAPGAILNALKSIIPGPLRNLAKRIPVVGGLFRREGGIVRRYQEGGLVPIVASGGEMMVHGNRAAMIPGPSDRDATPMLAPLGAAILTRDGQERMAMGASLADAIREQAPHFMAGGRVADVARRAGFRGNRLITSLAVSKGESGWDEKARNRNRDGTIDRGLWQINSGHGRLSTFDPQGNASAAYKISNAGRNWRPWVVYQKGLHQRHMAAARAAAGAGGGSSASRRKQLEAQIERNMDKLDELRNQAAAITGKGSAERRRPIQAQIRKLITANRKLRNQIRDLPKDSDRDRPVILGRSRRRAGLLDDAFSQGQSAGQAGLTLRVMKREGSPVLRAIAEAISGAGTQPDKGGDRSRGRSQGEVLGNLPAGSRIARMHAKASAIDRKRYQYAWGGGHGQLGVPSVGSRTPRGGKRGLGYDCSGAVSAVLGAGGLLKSPLTSGGLMGWGKKGAGKNLAVHTDPGHVIMRIGRRFWGTGEANPNGGAGWLPRNTMRGRGVTRTWPGLRAGGIIGRYQPGGRVGSRLAGGLQAAMTFAGGSYEAMNNLIARSLEARLAVLRTQILARVRKGGPAKVVQRLQGVIDMIDFELGRRVGRIQDVVEQRSAQLDRGRGAAERSMRMAGIPAEGSRGLGIMGALQAAETTVRRQNVASLTRALRTATRARNRAAIREVTQQLHEAQDALHESMVRQVELFRDQIRALGQEAVNVAQFHLGWAQTNMGILEAHQRLTRTQETPEGMRQRATTIQTGVIPALEASRAHHLYNAQMLAAIGDVDGWRAAMQDAHSATVELMNAQADAADLIRDAAARAAQDRVDLATHGRTMGDLALQRLALEQRLLGTYESTGGAQGRADFIRQQILPAIQAEITALIAQQAAAQQAGDPVLARQIAEAIAGKKNEQLQAQLDALQQIADNTEALKEFGGSTAFSLRDQIYTDDALDIIRARAGA